MPADERFKSIFTIIRPLIPLKLVVFLFYGGIFSLLPFLSIHMKALGLSPQQTAIVYAIILLASCAGAPIAGFLVDKTGGFKLILCISIIVTAVLHTCLLLVPTVYTRTYPMTANFRCTPAGGYIFMNSCLPLDPTDAATCALGNDFESDIIEFDSCTYLCPNVTHFPKLSHIPAPKNESKICFNKNFLRRFSKDEGQNCENFDPEVLHTKDIRFSHYLLMYSSYHNCVYQILESKKKGETFQDVRCPAWSFFCHVECQIKFPKIKLTCDEKVGDLDVTFYVYFALRLLCMLSLAATYPLVESAILILTKKHDGEFGKQRMFSHFAQALFPPCVGLLIDRFGSVYGGPSSYIPAFIMFDVLMLMTVVVVIFSLSVEMTAQPKLNVTDFKRLLHCWDAAFLFLAVFFLGAIWGFLETFLFWFLQDIGSDKLLLGLTRTVGSLVCIPPMFFADTIMNKVGRSNLIATAFLAYAVQLICYAFLRDPVWAVAVEALKFFSSALKLAAIVTLANKLAPKGLLATMQATTRCLQYEVGSGIGNLIGGSLAATLNFRLAFKILGVTSGLIGFLYAVAHYSLGSRKLLSIESPEEVKPEGKNGKVDGQSSNAVEEVYPESQV